MEKPLEVAAASADEMVLSDFKSSLFFLPKKQHEFLFKELEMYWLVQIK